MTTLPTSTALAWNESFGEWFNLSIPGGEFAAVIAPDAGLAEALASFDLAVVSKEDEDLTEAGMESLKTFYALLDRLGDCVAQYLLGRPWHRHPNKPGCRIDADAKARREFFVPLDEAAKARGWESPQGWWSIEDEALYADSERHFVS